MFSGISEEKNNENSTPKIVQQKTPKQLACFQSLFKEFTLPFDTAYDVISRFIGAKNVEEKKILSESLLSYFMTENQRKKIFKQDVEKYEPNVKKYFVANTSSWINHIREKFEITKQQLDNPENYVSIAEEIARYEQSRGTVPEKWDNSKTKPCTNYPMTSKTIVKAGINASYATEKDQVLISGAGPKSQRINPSSMTSIKNKDYMYDFFIKENIKLIIALGKENKNNEGDYDCYEDYKPKQGQYKTSSRAVLEDGIPTTIFQIKETKNSKTKAEIKKINFAVPDVKPINLNAYGLGAFLEIYQHYEQYLKTNSDKIYLHCTSGVGRTGTFMLMMLLFKQLKTDSEFKSIIDNINTEGELITIHKNYLVEKILDIVKALRTSRYAIQREQQFRIALLHLPLFANMLNPKCNIAKIEELRKIYELNKLPDTPITTYAGSQPYLGVSFKSLIQALEKEYLLTEIERHGSIPGKVFYLFKKTLGFNRRISPKIIIHTLQRRKLNDLQKITYLTLYKSGLKEENGKLKQILNNSLSCLPGIYKNRSGLIQKHKLAMPLVKYIDELEQSNQLRPNFDQKHGFTMACIADFYLRKIVENKTLPSIGEGQFKSILKEYKITSSLTESFQKFKESKLYTLLPKEKLKKEKKKKNVFL